MPRESTERWLLPAVGLVLGGAAAILRVAEGTPSWLRNLAAVALAAAFVAPALPFLVLPPWYLAARLRGLVPRTNDTWEVRVEGDDLALVHRGRTRRVEVRAIRRLRQARNDNWTESKLLEDGLVFYGRFGRAFAAIPSRSTGVREVLRVFAERGVPLEEVFVSAPAFLD